MLSITNFLDDFNILYRKEKRPVVIYGAGGGYRRMKPFLPEFVMLCDRNAKKIQSCDGIEVKEPDLIQQFDEPVYIISVVNIPGAFEGICNDLKELEIDAVLFDAYNNIAFQYDYWSTPYSYHADSCDKSLRVNLVCNSSGWILEKFAVRMESELRQMGVDVHITDEPKEDADINHHIQCGGWRPFANDTLMITHVDSQYLFESIKKQLQTARLGICMSRETMESLTLWGIPRGKLCYVNPAHDGKMSPRKYTIGITHKTHEFDLRKRISALFEILEDICPDFFRFIIMGAGWDAPIEKLRGMGFDVTYYPTFDYETYSTIVPKFDYYLFMGFDEGSMGYLDALAAGVGTIVTPQGFHLDNNCPIDYPCRNVNEFHNAFLELQNKKSYKIESVRNWTWENYSKKHLRIWEYITRRKPMEELYSEQLCCEDGIYSMLLEDNRIAYDTSTKTIR